MPQSQDPNMPINTNDDDSWEEVGQHGKNVRHIGRKVHKAYPKEC